MRPGLAVRSLFIVLLAAVTLLAGCSKEKQDSTPLPDAATLLKDASATTKAQQSVHLVLTVTGKIDELPIESLQGDLTNVPTVAAQGTVNVDFGGQKLKDAGFSVFDGVLYAQVMGKQYLDLGPAKDIYDIGAILNPDNGLANILANFEDPKAESHEDVAGTPTVRITGNVSADAVNKIAPQLKADGPVPGTAWIKEDGNALVQVALSPKEDTSITMTLSDWGKPVTVTKPAS